MQEGLWPLGWAALSLAAPNPYVAVTPSHGTTQMSSRTSNCALGLGVWAEDQRAGTSARRMTRGRIARNRNLSPSLSLSVSLFAHRVKCYNSIQLWGCLLSAPHTIKRNIYLPFQGLICTSCLCSFYNIFILKFVLP